MSGILLMFQRGIIRNFNFLIELEDSGFVGEFLRTLLHSSFYIFYKQVSSTDTNKKNQPVSTKVGREIAWRRCFQGLKVKQN